MPSFVIIWENNTVGHKKVKSHGWPGHAAMNIGQRFASKKMTGNLNNYVSWWPEGEDGDFGFVGVVKSFFGKKTTGNRETHFQTDVSAEKYLPDHVVRLDSTKEQENNMKAEWLSIVNKEGGSSYSNLRQNCATIVSRVLHGGGFYSMKWAVNSNFAWTPADVLKLSLDAGGVQMQWDDFLKVLAKSSILPEDLIRNKSKKQIWRARSGAYCSTGAPCEHQQHLAPDPRRKGIILE